MLFSSSARPPSSWRREDHTCGRYERLSGPHSCSRWRTRLINLFRSDNMDIAHSQTKHHQHVQRKESFQLLHFQLWSCWFNQIIKYLFNNLVLMFSSSWSCYRLFQHQWGSWTRHNDEKIISVNMFLDLDPSRVCKGRGVVTLRATLVHIDDEGHITEKPNTFTTPSKSRETAVVHSSARDVTIWWLPAHVR